MLIAAFANLYLNVRKPREILPDLRTLGSPVAWASGRGCRVPAGHEGRLRPVPRGRTRGRRDSAPDEDPRSTSSPTRSRRRGARAVGPTRCGGAGGEPESPRPALSTSLPPSRVSGWPGRASAEGLGLRYPLSQAVKSPLSPPGKRPSAGWRPASGRVEEGPRGLSLAAGGEAPEAGLTSATPTCDLRAGVSHSRPPGCAFSPPASASPAAPLPAPSLVHRGRRAERRRAGPSRAEQPPATRRRFKRSAGPRPGAAVVRTALRSSPLFPPWFLSAPVSNLAPGAPLACPHAAHRPGPRRRPLLRADPF